MHFLAQRPLLVPSDGGGKHTSFFADVFAPRPPFDEMLGFKDRVVEGNPQIRTWGDVEVQFPAKQYRPTPTQRLGAQASG